jgi:hypothetical protein
MMLTNEDELGPFKNADSVAAIMAYVHAKMGKDSLKAFLSQVETDKESLERDAAKLDAVGLPEVAAIVLEAAANALPANILLCPYAETDSHNYEGWQAGYQRKRANSRHSKWPYP